MANTVERECPLLLFSSENDGGGSKITELSQTLMKGNDDDKAKAIKQVISKIISGVDMSRLTMQIIQFCLRSRDHKIKKLLQIYWEVLDKKDAKTGKLKAEMILVCNHLLQDLKHPNEYIRGSTARLLCRIDEPEILEQLIPQVLMNLEHRDNYVRKNSVLAIMAMYTKHPELIPDAPQRINSILTNENNMLVRRNAFLMLTNCDLRMALDFFIKTSDKLISYPETMQITILELMRKVCRTLPVPKAIFVRSAVLLLDSPSNAVVYEAANTLLSLTPLDSAVNKALEAYTRLLQSESDQNVKLIVINRLNSLKVRYERNLRNIVMDILRCLSTPNIDIRKQILSLTLDLASINNIRDIIDFLKKQIMKTDNQNEMASSTDSQQNILYRNILVETIHQCAVKFPSVASNVVHLLMNYLGDDNEQASNDVIIFVKEILEEYMDLRKSILTKLFESFKDIKTQKVYRVGLWIFGEYSLDIKTINESINVILECIGELPLEADNINDSVDDDSKGDDVKTMEDSKPKFVTRTVILDDGTYAQETIQTNANVNMDSTLDDGGKIIPTLRTLIKSGEYYLIAVLSTTVLKLILRLKSLINRDNKNELKLLNELNAKCLLMLTTILRYSLSDNVKSKIDNDTKDRIIYVINCLLNKNYVNNKLQSCILNKTKNNFGIMLKKKRHADELKKIELKKTKIDDEKIEFDTLLNLRHLKGNEFIGFDEDDKINIMKSVGGGKGTPNNRSKGSNDISLKTRLSRVHQLTGFSDNIYAEACVTVHQFDIVLDFLILNNTEFTMQNVNLELHTSGDLKLIDKPQPFTLASKKSKKLKASIKVSSTENGVIFGNIVYESTKYNQITKSKGDKNIVVMNCIHMDIMDYVKPAPCDEKDFRDMWYEFEWENKVPVNTDINNLTEYLHHIANITNMQLLTPIDDITKSNCMFLAANLHAKSIFGEHALMNVSIEYKNDDTNTRTSNDLSSANNNDIKTKVAGHIRIRCKSQGIALSLGEKITNKQKKIEQ